MALLAEHALLYALRSPTTPLADKVASASSALDAQPGNVSLAATVRDWAVDALLRATRQQASVAGTAAILDADLWELAARTTEATLSTSPVAASTLPIFVAFVTQYSQAASDVQLLRSAASVWSRLAANALRKATADASLDAYEKLLEASLRVFSREEGAGTVDEREVWTELAVNWLKPFRSVALEAGKGGKKIPSHTLSLLPTLLPLLSRLSPTSPLRTSLLQTLQLAIFNLENLRRGLARDSYTAGGASTSSQPAPSTADSELLAALASLPSTGTAAAYDAIPSLTQIYFSAVATHAETLFPLPAKATFATPSAQKSAREVLGLTKRREMAGRWIRGVIDYLSWPKEANAMETDEVGLEEVKSAALAGSLAVVEQNDLHRPGQAGESWDKVLPDIVSGAVSRLEGSVNSANPRSSSHPRRSRWHARPLHSSDSRARRLPPSPHRAPLPLRHSADTPHSHRGRPRLRSFVDLERQRPHLAHLPQPARYGRRRHRRWTKRRPCSVADPRRPSARCTPTKRDDRSGGCDGRAQPSKEAQAFLRPALFGSSRRLSPPSRRRSHPPRSRLVAFRPRRAAASLRRRGHRLASQRLCEG
ncbi:hypothetical protein BJY59DRAFT_146584 [Rhodotorula toruloides]